MKQIGPNTYVIRDKYSIFHMVIDILLSLVLVPVPKRMHESINKSKQKIQRALASWIFRGSLSFVDQQISGAKYLNNILKILCLQKIFFPKLVSFWPHQVLLGGGLQKLSKHRQYCNKKKKKVLTSWMFRESLLIVDWNVNRAMYLKHYLQVSTGTSLSVWSQFDFVLTYLTLN